MFKGRHTQCYLNVHPNLIFRSTFVDRILYEKYEMVFSVVKYLIIIDRQLLVFSSVQLVISVSVSVHCAVWMLEHNSYHQSVT